MSRLSDPCWLKRLARYAGSFEMEYWIRLVRL